MKKRFLFSLYSASPVIFQNIAVSCKGALNRQVRFGGEFTKELSEASARLQKSSEEISQYQASQLSKFLIFAKTNSHFYADRLANFTRNDLLSAPFQVLNEVPVLEKKDIRQHNDHLRSLPKSLIAHHARTSGTTGTPLAVGFTKHDMQRRFAFLYRMLGEFGISHYSRNARFSGGTFFPGAERNKIFWRLNYSQRQAFLSSYHLHENNAGHYIDFLKKYQPEYIDGYPSAMYLLSKHLIRYGLQGSIRTKVFMSTGETLEEFQRATIAEAFPRMSVLNQYASAEGAPFITENKEGELVVNLDSGVFEFVRPGTKVPAAPGEIGEMLVTSFTTHAYPLIRYRIGDTVLVSEKFSKTWKMPVVGAIYGRRDDLVWSPHRGWVGRLSPAIKVGSSCIQEAQVAQVALDCFALRIFSVGDANMKKDIAPVIEALKDRLGPVEIKVEVHREPLPRGANGKLRAIIALPYDQLPAEAKL